MPRSKPAHVLPDRLAPDLPIWFVGTAAGPRSAAEGAYYAHPGNRFWPALRDAGITPRLFRPHQYPALLALGVGLTDMCKVSWGVDADIDPGHFDIRGFQAKVRRLRPCALAFTGKGAAAHYLGRRTSRLPVGRMADAPDGPVIFVLPSPSGLASSYWSIEPWREAGAFLRAQTRAPRIARA